MFKRILVPRDGSPRAEQALSVAARLAQASERTPLFIPNRVCRKIPSLERTLWALITPREARHGTRCLLPSSFRPRCDPGARR